jgi:hypothetical protein
MLAFYGERGANFLWYRVIEYYATLAHYVALKNYSSW